MPIFRKKTTIYPTDNQTGFGSNATNYGGRFLDKNGLANVERKGLSFFDQISWFHTLLRLPMWKFQLSIFVAFFIINIFFALLYYLIGIDQLNGIHATNEFEKFCQSFFFSSQTFTTVGYGHISPKSGLASSIASLEALVGLLSFALATGLIYGRFSKPTAFLKFSKNAIISKLNNEKALMFRIAPYKDTNLTESEVTVTLGLIEERNGNKINRFFPLKLEIAKINMLSLSWTLVHLINEDSPLFGFKKEDFKNKKGEILVFFKAFDEMFSNTIVSRTSYTLDEIVYGAKFNQIFEHSPNNAKTIIHLDLINSYEMIKDF